MKITVPATHAELIMLCQKYKCQPYELKLKQFEDIACSLPRPQIKKTRFQMLEIK